MTNQSKIAKARTSILRQRTKKDRLHVTIARGIGERILGGEFPSGAALPNEAEWGQIYKASRTAVREALKTLMAKGLISSRPKIGSRVEPRSNWNILDREVMEWHHAAADRKSFVAKTQEARKLLEPGMAELAAAKRTPAQLERLSEALRWMERARTVPDTIAADIEFHAALVECANNELLVPFGIIIEKALATLFEFTTTRNPHYDLALNLHRAIVRKVKAGDGPGARKAMLALLGDTDRVLQKRKG
jgi:DNA-binding FadR family transcriptional regulator